jgi:hypothetical protein
MQSLHSIQIISDQETATPEPVLFPEIEHIENSVFFGMLDSDEQYRVLEVPSEAGRRATIKSILDRKFP